MKKDILQEIPKANKVDFLNKLSSGQFLLIKPYEPQPPLSFDLQEGNLYLCRETGKTMSQDQIESLPGYRMNIQLVSDRLQVAGKKPPSGIRLMPFSRTQYLDSLLKNKSEVVITFNESEGVFKSETDSYSFASLMQIGHDSPEVVFIMDKKTTEKYIELLEKWC